MSVVVAWARAAERVTTFASDTHRRGWAAAPSPFPADHFDVEEAHQGKAVT